MRTAAEYCNIYREVTRHMWNTALYDLQEGERDYDLVERCSRICDELFDEIVVCSLGEDGFRKENSSSPYPFLRVVPNVDPFSIMVNRTTPESGYWDDPHKSLRLDGLEIRFVSYYDWDVCGLHDWKYLRVLIESCSEHPHLVGRHALIQVHHAEVQYQTWKGAPEEP